MQEADFKVGVTIKYDNIVGDVQFVGDDYITFCVSERESTCEHSLYPTCKVAMLIYPHQFKDCELVTNNNSTEDSTLSAYKSQKYRYSDIQ
tara:strand:+ start:756 stop:1028 length:273 start_codon:yes stop_codon:yes gene_type:complete